VDKGKRERSSAGGERAERSIRPSPVRGGAAAPAVARRAAGDPNREHGNEAVDRRITVLLDRVHVVDAHRRILEEARDVADVILICIAVG
jgi:hypothetical protein